MRSAPAVNYPVGPSTLGAGAQVLPWALAAIVCACWALQGVQPRLAATLTGACCLVAVVAGWAARHDAAGALQWDGRLWTLHEGGFAYVGTLDAALDLQVVMLVALRSRQKRGHWLWLHRSSDPRRWADVRRAVYASRGSASTSAATGAVR